MNRALIVVPLLLLALAGLFLVLRPDPSGGSRERALDVDIEEGVMDPEEVTVGEDDQVTLRITSGAPVEFHKEIGLGTACFSWRRKTRCTASPMIK